MSAVMFREKKLFGTRAVTVKGVALALSLLAGAVCVRADDGPPTLPSPLCDSLVVPAGNEVVFHVYAVGVQIYRWNGSAWVFVAPSALLYADAGFNGLVGMHFLTPGQGPTWETTSGSQVIGARQAACTPDPTAIPWLKLRAVSSTGPGVLDGVTFIQRVNTVGGIAPSSPGTTVGQEADVPYMAEYYFYNAAQLESDQEAD
jgi:hypothetical protein